MTYPIPNYTRVWVRGHLVDLVKAGSGDASFGVAKEMLFIPSPAVLIDRGTNQIIATGAFRVMPEESDGYFAIQLPATDDQDITPTNFTYRVVEPTGRNSYHIMVPALSPVITDPLDPLVGQRVLNLSDVLPSPNAGGGTVQLARGVGIQTMEVVSGDIIAHYDDGRSEVIGEMPTSVAGPPGIQGPPGVKGDTGATGSTGPATTNASLLTSGTLSDARMPLRTGTPSTNSAGATLTISPSTATSAIQNFTVTGTTVAVSMGAGGIDRQVVRASFFKSSAYNVTFNSAIRVASGITPPISATTNQLVIVAFEYFASAGAWVLTAATVA